MRSLTIRYAGPDVVVIQDNDTRKIVATLRKFAPLWLMEIGVTEEKWEATGEVNGEWKSVGMGEFLSIRNKVLDAVSSRSWMLFDE